MRCMGPKRGTNLRSCFVVHTVKDDLFYILSLTAQAKCTYHYSTISYMFQQFTAICREQHSYLKLNKASYIYSNKMSQSSLLINHICNNVAYFIL